MKSYPEAITMNTGAITEIILEKWNVPDIIIRPASDFNNPSEGSSDSHKVTAIVHVACRLSHLLDIGFGHTASVDEISPDIISRIGFPRGLEPLLPSIFKELSSAGLLQKNNYEDSY